MNELELLRRFEPVLRFTRGEKFYPIDTKAYLQESSLWVQEPDRPARCLISEQDLTLENLGELSLNGHDGIYFLQFIEPLDISALASYLVKNTLKKKNPQDVFRSGRGRLSRVGYSSRILDSLFSISLLARGRLPGDRALAAWITYQRMCESSPGHRYYGRVLRQSGWIVLQYWFFYVYNNWRSGYYGANDHEADWEMINVYLYEDTDGEVHPEWAAYASHEFAGDDFRRRWDDPELQKVGDHPVVYVGIGSHASYFSQGDYLTEIEIPFLASIGRFFKRTSKLWRRFLRRTIGEEVGGESSSSVSVFTVPFVDYARGDGLSIGEDSQVAWDDPVVLNPVPDWVTNYRGLWGFYAHDPFAGENAPSGMKYNRNGEVRRAWYDPLGWAGLHKVPPPNQQLPMITRRKLDLDTENQALRLQMTEKQNQLSILDIETNAIRGLPYLISTYNQHQAQMTALSEEVQNLCKKMTWNETMIGTLTEYEDRLKMGLKESPRAHLNRPLIPEPESALRLGWLAEIWSALSIGLMLIASVALALFAREYLYFGLLSIMVSIVFLEAGFRRKLSNLINTLAILLAVICMLILLYEYFWIMLLTVVVIASIYILWQNIREMWS